MSLNWVERTARNSGTSVPFVLLPDENILHAQQERVSVRLLPIGQQNPEAITIKGHIYITNQRIVVLSDAREVATADTALSNDSFALLLRDVLSFKLEMPWFGSNKYRLTFRISDGNGGLNYLYRWEATVEFSLGGAISFHEHFQQAYARYTATKDLGMEPLPEYTA